MDRRTRILEAEARAGDMDAARELDMLRAREAGKSVRPLWVAEVRGVHHVAIASNLTACGAPLFGSSKSWEPWAGEKGVPLIPSACGVCHQRLIEQTGSQFARMVGRMVSECRRWGYPRPSAAELGFRLVPVARGSALTEAEVARLRLQDGTLL